VEAPRTTYGTTFWRLRSRRAAKVWLVGSALFTLAWVVFCVGLAITVADEDKGTSRGVVALLLALFWAAMGLLLVREMYRSPFQGELTPSGCLRLTSLSGMQEGSVQSVARVQRMESRDLGMRFQIKWEHGRVVLPPSLLVEHILDANPSIMVWNYSAEERQRVRQRLLSESRDPDGH